MLLNILSNLYNMFEHTHLQSIIKRLQEPRRFIQVLLGPHQVGKTTLIFQFLEKTRISHHFASADAVAASDIIWLEQQWEIARLKMEQEGAEEFLLVNSNQYVWFGGYPGSAGLINEEERWKAYVQQSLIETSISKDILMLTRIDKPALMKRLFELGCSYSGQILSYNKMMGQMLDAGNTTILSHYLDLLNTAGLLAAIEKYSGNLIYKRSSSPKFQVHNTALISAQSGELFKDIIIRPNDWGRWVESSIGAYLINCSIIEGFTVSYWRERNEEVDFVMEKKGKVIGLEVKSGARQSSSGISAFKKAFNSDKIILIGTSEIPWQDFLKLNPAQLF